MGDLQVYSIGDKGVVRIKNPHAAENDELLSAQNAIDDKRRGRHALGKRPGMTTFTTLQGAVLAIFVGGATLPPSPGTSVEGSATPRGSLYTALLDLVYMRCRLYLTAASTAISDNANVSIGWTAAEFDIGVAHPLGNTVVTIPNAGDGLYLIIGQVKWGPSASGKKRGLQILKNFAIQFAHDGAADDAGEGMTQQVVGVLPLVAGDGLSLQIHQDTGASVNLLGGSVEETSFLVLRIVQSVDTPLPRCHVYKTGNQLLSDGVPAIVELDAEAFDNAAMHDIVTDNTRVVVPSGHDGLYTITGHVSFAEAMVGHVQVDLLKNGFQVLARTKLAGINASEDPDVTGQVTGAFEMTAGDSVELQVTYYANPGASPTWPLLGGGTSDIALARTSLAMARIG